MGPLNFGCLFILIQKLKKKRLNPVLFEGSHQLPTAFMAECFLACKVTRGMSGCPELINEALNVNMKPLTIQ